MPRQDPPLPPFDEAAAWQKVLGAEAAWNILGPRPEGDTAGIPLR